MHRAGKTGVTRYTDTDTGEYKAKAVPTASDYAKEIAWREAQDEKVYWDRETKGTYENPIKSEKYDNGLFNSPEEAAYAFGMKYNEQSINEDREYGANILAVEKNGETKYTYDKAYKGSPSSIVKMAAADYLNRALLALSPIKSETIPVGSVHTHSAWEDRDGKSYDSTLFLSPEDEKYLLGVTYMISPDGALHYSQGTTSEFRDKDKQESLESLGYDYGEIVRWGLPGDPNTTPYTP